MLMYSKVLGAMHYTRRLLHYTTTYHALYQKTTTLYDNVSCTIPEDYYTIRQRVMHYTRRLLHYTITYHALYQKTTTLYDNVSCTIPEDYYTIRQRIITTGYDHQTLHSVEHNAANASNDVSQAHILIYTYTHVHIDLAKLLSFVCEVKKRTIWPSSVSRVSAYRNIC
jgi:hypothetical protein